MTRAIIQKPPRRSLRRGAALFFVTLFVILAFTCCESMPRKKPLTVEDEWVVAEFGRNFRDFDGFRFYVSKRITLVQAERTLEADDNLTIVTDERGRGRILLKKNTEGRHQPNYKPPLHQRDYPRNVRWVAFDPGEGEPLPIAFAPGKPDDDKYYLVLHWRDPRTGMLVTNAAAGEKDKKYIIYNGYPHIVDYFGSDPPYLLFNIVGEKKNKTQIMRGMP